jgi:hypothetical protein
MLPNIRNDAINALVGLTEGTLSYVRYTHMLNDFLRRSRQPLTDYIPCVRFSDNGRANFQLRTQAKSHRS